MAPNPAAGIEARDLVKDFGPFRAVDGVSFKIDRGSVLGFAACATP
jgi:ABC-type multidrug transport system ATPase subunit